MIRLLMLQVLTLVTLLLLIDVVRADSGLPFGITCDQVVQYTQDMNIPNTTTGRAQARIIALTFGHWLTNAEFAAAARCLKQAQSTGCDGKGKC